MPRTVFVLALVACGHPASPAVPPPPPAAAALRGGAPIATPGEHMHYRLSLQGIELATYDFAIGEPTEVAGKPAVVVSGHAKVNGLAAVLATIDDRFVSWVGLSDGRPLRFQVDEYASGSKTDIEHVVVDLAARTADSVPVSFHLNAAAPQPEPQHTTLAEAWDVNALLLALRGWEGPAGSAITVEVFRSRFLWHAELTIHGKERMRTELGELPALRIEGRTYKVDRKAVRDAGSAERRFTIWISDDDARVPLEVKAVTDYGDLRMQIVDYQSGASINGGLSRPPSPGGAGGFTPPRVSRAALHLRTVCSACDAAR